MGEGRGGAHIGRVYPPGSSNSPARHSPSASRALAGGPSPGRHADGDPPLGAFGSPAHTLARWQGPQGPLSWSSDTQEGAHLHPASGAGGQDPGEGAPLSAAPPSPPGKEGRSSSSSGVFQSRKGLSHTPPGGRRRGGGYREGGGGGGGDSATLRPPPRNFAAAGAAVATGTESFCSPMSGLPGQTGGWEAATSRWDPGPATLPRGLPAAERPDSSRLSPPYPPFTKPIPVKPGFFKLLGLSDRVSP